MKRPQKYQWKNVRGELDRLSAQMAPAPAPASPEQWIGRLTFLDLQKADTAVRAMLSAGWPECAENTRAQLQLRMLVAAEFADLMAHLDKPCPFHSLQEGLEELLIALWYRSALEWARNRALGDGVSC